MSSLAARIMAILSVDFRPGYVREFHDAVKNAIADGKLTEDEIAELEKRREELGLSESALSAVRQELYMTAFHTVTEKEEVSESELDELEHIQEYLGLEDAEIARSKKQLYRMRILSEIRKGNMPVVDDDALQLRPGETLHWKAGVELLHAGKGRQVQSEHAILKLPIGIGSRTKQKDEPLVHGWLPQDHGTLYITSKAFVFVGKVDSIRLSFRTINFVRCFTTGLRVDATGDPIRLFRYKNKEDASLIGSIAVSAMDIAA